MYQSRQKNHWYMTLRGRTHVGLHLALFEGQAATDPTFGLDKRQRALLLWPHCPWLAPRIPGLALLKLLPCLQTSVCPTHACLRLPTSSSSCSLPHSHMHEALSSLIAVSAQGDTAGFGFVRDANLAALLAARVGFRGLTRRPRPAAVHAVAKAVGPVPRLADRQQVAGGSALCIRRTSSRSTSAWDSGRRDALFLLWACKASVGLLSKHRRARAE